MASAPRQELSRTEMVAILVALLAALVAYFVSGGAAASTKPCVAGASAGSGQSCDSLVSVTRPASRADLASRTDLASRGIELVVQPVDLGALRPRRTTPVHAASTTARPSAERASGSGHG